MLAALALVLLPAPLPAGPAFEQVAVFPAPEAHQAVAVDADHFYAIGNRVVAQYDRRTGERLAVVEAGPDLPLVHLNGGVVRNGRLLCSHSNFPRAPFTGSVERFALNPLRHERSISLGVTNGSLTAVDEPAAGSLLTVFAHYELPRIPGYNTGVGRTEVQVRTLPGVTEGWVLPDSIIDRLRPHSVSGASVRPGEEGTGRLWLAGHDRPEVYRVRVPPAGSELILEAVHPAPIAGQGIAWDPSEPGVLWGTRRGEGLVVKMRLEE